MKDAIVAAILHPDVDLEADDEIKGLIEGQMGGVKPGTSVTKRKKSEGDLIVDKIKRYVKQQNKRIDEDEKGEKDDGQSYINRSRNNSKSNRVTSGIGRNEEIQKFERPFSEHIPETKETFASSEKRIDVYNLSETSDGIEFSQPECNSARLEISLNCDKKSTEILHQRTSANMKKISVQPSVNDVSLLQTVNHDNSSRIGEPDKVKGVSTVETESETPTTRSEVVPKKNKPPIWSNKNKLPKHSIEISPSPISLNKEERKLKSSEAKTLANIPSPPPYQTDKLAHSSATLEKTKRDIELKNYEVKYNETDRNKSHDIPKNQMISSNINRDGITNGNKLLGKVNFDNKIRKDERENASFSIADTGVIKKVGDILSQDNLDTNSDIPILDKTPISGSECVLNM